MLPILLRTVENYGTLGAGCRVQWTDYSRGCGDRAASPASAANGARSAEGVHGPGECRARVSSDEEQEIDEEAARFGWYVKPKPAP